MKSFHVKITGRVQGVCYRAWAREEARKRGLHGFVKNCHDGSVEAVFEGEDHAVQEMIAICHKGPFMARVESINVTESPETHGYASFEIL